MEAPPEKYAYTLMLSPDFSQPDGLAVVDVDPDSSKFGKIVHKVMMPNMGDEFHHFGWNACSSALSPLSGHAFLERRYLIIPGIRSSRIYIIDTKGGPKKAKIHKIIEPEEVFRKTGYSRPHTIHCGPEGIYVSTLGGGGKDGTSSTANWLSNMSKTLPPMMQVMKDIGGVEIPDTLMNLGGIAKPEAKPEADAEEPVAEEKPIKPEVL